MEITVLSVNSDTEHLAKKVRANVPLIMEAWDLKKICPIYIHDFGNHYDWEYNKINLSPVRTMDKIIWKPSIRSRLERFKCDPELFLLAHEIRHYWQWQTGALSHDKETDEFIWKPYSKSARYPVSKIANLTYSSGSDINEEYLNLPWEKEANIEAYQLVKELCNGLERKKTHYIRY